MDRWKWCCREGCMKQACTCASLRVEAPQFEIGNHTHPYISISLLTIVYIHQPSTHIKRAPHKYIYWFLHFFSKVVPSIKIFFQLMNLNYIYACKHMRIIITKHRMGTGKLNQRYINIVDYRWQNHYFNWNVEFLKLRASSK